MPAATATDRLQEAEAAIAEINQTHGLALRLSPHGTYGSYTTYEVRDGEEVILAATSLPFVPLFLHGFLAGAKKVGTPW